MKQTTTTTTTTELYPTKWCRLHASNDTIMFSNTIFLFNTFVLNSLDFKTKHKS